MRLHFTHTPSPYDHLSLGDTVGKPAKEPFESSPRPLISEILTNYNKEIGNSSPKASENCKKIGEEGNFCVVTGQQLGYLGGPLYTILKAITCLAVAKEMGAVPIFWLATEDHDIDEVNHTYFLDSKGNLDKWKISLPKMGQALESTLLDETLAEEIKKDLERLGEPDLLGEIEVGMSYPRLMVRALLALFADSGLLFLEPKCLRRLAIPLFHDEVVEAKNIRKLMQDLPGPLDFEGEGTNLFYIEEGGVRKKIGMEGELYTIGEKNLGVDALLALIERHPERFSPNVAARPLMQNLLLPICAYVGGPGEIAYHRQLEALHEFHGIQMPALIPRLSATFIPDAAEKWLAPYHMEPWGDLSLLKERGMPGQALHTLQNLIRPYDAFQERTFNFWNFQRETRENLVQELLKMCDWKRLGHYYCMMEPK